MFPSEISKRDGQPAPSRDVRWQDTTASAFGLAEGHEGLRDTASAFGLAEGHEGLQDAHSATDVYSRRSVAKTWGRGRDVGIAF